MLLLEKNCFIFLGKNKIKLLIDSCFRPLYFLADNDDQIVDFANFC